MKRKAYAATLIWYIVLLNFVFCRCYWQLCLFWEENFQKSLFPCQHNVYIHATTCWHI